MLRGFFKNNCPYITITLAGDTSSKEIDVLVDTGFNGYLTLPEHIAQEIGLVAMGVGSSIIADGSSSPYIDYRGTAIYNNKRIITDVEVQPHCKILLGMALLDALKLNLFVDLQAERVELNSSDTKQYDLKR